MRSTVFKECHDKSMLVAKKEGYWSPEFEENSREVADYLDRLVDDHGTEAVFNPSFKPPPLYTLYRSPTDHPLWSKKAERAS